MAENFTSIEFAGLAGRADARFRGMPVATKGQKIAVTAVATSNSIDLPLDSHVMLTATQACFIRLGITATGSDAAVDVDMYLLPSIPYLIRMGKDTSNVAYRRISAIRATADGTLYIMPMVAE